MGLRRLLAERVDIPTPPGLEQRDAPLLLSPFATFGLWFREGWRNKEQWERAGLLPGSETYEPPVAGPLVGYEHGRGPPGAALLEQVPDTLYSTVRLEVASGATLYFFGYCEGGEVSGAFGSCASSMHTNLQMANCLPVPKVFMIDSVRLDAYDHAENTIPPSELRAMLPPSLVFNLTIGVKDYVSQPAWMLAEQGVRFEKQLFIPSLMNFSATIRSHHVRGSDWERDGVGIWLVCSLKGTLGRDVL